MPLPWLSALVALPIETRDELYRPAGIRSGERRHLEVAQDVRAADPALGAVAVGGLRQRNEVRLVEGVQHVQTELEVGMAGQFGALADADVGLPEHRTGDDERARRAVAISRRTVDLDAVGSVGRREVATGRRRAGVARRRRRARGEGQDSLG